MFKYEIVYIIVMVVGMKRTVRVDIEYDNEELGFENIRANIESIPCKVTRLVWVS